MSGAKMTDMPEVIRLTERTDADKLEYWKNQWSVLFVKHEELKAIADKMDSVFEYCEFMMSNAGLDCLPIYNIKTEYNKYKGE